jgi:hypothetical protein
MRMSAQASFWKLNVLSKLDDQIQLALRSRKLAIWLFGKQALPLIEKLRPVEDGSEEVLSDAELRGDFRD